MKNRKMFFDILDNEWSYFWHSASVSAPRIKQYFIEYFKYLLDIDVSPNTPTSEERFVNLMNKKYICNNDYFIVIDFYFFDFFKNLILIRVIKR